MTNILYKNLRTIPLLRLRKKFFYFCIGIFPLGQNKTFTVCMPSVIAYPMGADAGFVYICIDENCVGKVPIIYGQTVEMEPEPKRHFWDVIFGGRKS